MPACSTRRWRRVNGTRCRTICSGGAPAAKRRRRACAVRREERPRSVRRRAGRPSITAGAVEVVTGAASVGQGVETVVAQICADALGVDYRRVRVDPRPHRPHRIRHGRLRLARHRDDRRGDARLPPLEVRAKALDVAAELLQQAGRRARHCRRRGGAQGGAGGPSMTLGEIARRWRRPRSCAARARRASPPTAGSTPTT